MGILGSIVVWLVYFGATAAVIMIDGSMQKAKAEREGGVDFMNRSPWSYLALSLLCGPLPLIFYFGTTRKSVLGWLLGIGAASAVYGLTVVVATIMNIVLAKV